MKIYSLLYLVELFQNEEKKSELQNKGMNFVQLKFDIDKNVEKIVSLYR